MKNLIEEIKIHESAIFYKLNAKSKKPFNVASIEQLFLNVSKKKIEPFISKVVKEIETRTNKPIYYSLCIFKVSAIPSFLFNKTDIREEHLAYILIVEQGDYLAISKKYISDFDVLISDYAHPVDTSVIMHYRLVPEASIEKMNMKSMDMSNDQIRERTIQANNVGSTYAPINAEKNIVDRLRLRTSKEVIQVSGNSSRVSFPGRKAEYLKYFNKMIDEISRIKHYKKIPSYLDHFAERIVFEKEIQKSTPIGVLVSAYELYDYFESFNSVEFFVRDSKGKETLVNFDNIAGILNHTLRVVAPSQSTNEYKLTSTIGKSDPLLNTPEAEVLNDFSLEILKTKLAIRSKFLRNIIVYIENIEYGSLLKIFEEQKVLNAVFKPYGLIYRSGQLYREREFAKRAEIALSILHPMKGIESTICEKFPGKGIPPNASGFHQNSIFTWIEASSFKADADYLICDDLGNEWADYIVFKKGRYIKFLHAKAGDISLSATQFHDVVSQALKNIGNMRASAELSQKSQNWISPYAGKINKLRKFPTQTGAMSTFVEEYKEALIETEVGFEAWLVVNFISKEALTLEIEKLKKGKNIEPHVAQLISLLLRFVTGCQEAHVKPMIACRK